MDSESERKKARLTQYTKLQSVMDGITEELARRKSSQYTQIHLDSNGSKPTPNRSDRMANAIINRIAFEEAASAKLQQIDTEMGSIENAVLNLKDGLEQHVILLRYITGTNNGRQLKPWHEIAMKIYGNDSEAQMQAVFRIHRRALKNICIGG